MSDTLNQLAQVLEQRKTAAADSSYVAGLYHKGLDAILKKIGEEATETATAVFDPARPTAHAKRHLARLRRDTELLEQRRELWVVLMVEDDEAGVEVDRGFPILDHDGVRVPPEIVVLLEQRDLVSAVKLPRDDETSHSATDDGNPHPRLRSTSSSSPSLHVL